MKARTLPSYDFGHKQCWIQWRVKFLLVTLLPNFLQVNRFDIAGAPQQLEVVGGNRRDGVVDPLGCDGRHLRGAALHLHRKPGGMGRS